jgi:hypothetical protein
VAGSWIAASGLFMLGWPCVRRELAGTRKEWMFACKAIGKKRNVKKKNL